MKETELTNFEELGFRYLNNGCINKFTSDEDSVDEILLDSVDAIFETSDPVKIATKLAHYEKGIKPLALTIELVPRTTWGTEVGDTLRQAIGKKAWHDLREVEKLKCDNKCSICHSVKYDIEGRKPNLILHEVWDYDTSKVLRIDEPTEGEKGFGGTTTIWCEKTLIDLRIICPICNGIKHFGRIHSEYKHNIIPQETIIEVIEQFLIVNYESCIKRKIINTVYFTERDKAKMWMIFFMHLNHALDIWRTNSQYEWNPNFGKYSYLVKNKITTEKLR